MVVENLAVSGAVLRNVVVHTKRVRPSQFPSMNLEVLNSNQRMLIKPSEFGSVRVST